MATKCVLVKISFKRIQAFLFTVPRLRAMLGANTLLGEVVRKELPRLAVDCGSDKCKIIDAYKAETFEENDPLSLAATDQSKIPLHDSPELLYKNGILVRDGGRFHCCFCTGDEAIKFVSKARELIEEKLPGLRYEIDSDAIDRHSKDFSLGHQPTRLPHFQVCEDTGGGVAVKFEQYTEAEPEHYADSTVDMFENAGRRFIDKKSRTSDIIGLLEERLPLDDIPRAQDFKTFSGKSGYLALIHADGNSIGDRLKKWNGSLRKERSKVDDHSAVETELFFHSMRVAMRRATVDALHKTYGGKETPQSAKNVRPYQLLMLGGDDVLLLCSPENAFDFAVYLAREIKKHRIPYCRNDVGESERREISLGIGIAIAKKNVPFYLLHELAEQLAGSAKRLFRAQDAERTVVDWNIATTSWINDVGRHRYTYDLKINQVNGEKWCGISRPLFVLDDDGSGKGKKHTSLESLLDCAKGIQAAFENKQLSRSQFKEIANLIQQQEPQKASTYFNKYYEKRMKEHGNINLLFEGYELWQEVRPKEHLTTFRDLMELVEANYLGKLTQGGDR